MERVDEKEEEKDNRDDGCQKTWQPSFYIKVDKEIYYYAGHEISIWQSLDSYGAIIWPAALALCEYLDMNRETVNLLDKAVLELGAGTGLVSIVASLLGAWVTASDLPEVLGNLRSNLSRNTRGRCRYTPQVAEIFWDHELKEIFPRSVYRYDYILAADVVYHHDFLSELLATMRHFCQPGTTLIWSNKVRFESDLVFLKKFKAAFNTTLLADTGEVQIYSATTKESEEVRNFVLIPLENAEEKGDEKEEEEEVQGNTEEFYSGDSSNGKKQDQNSTDSVSKSIVDVEEFNEDVWVKDKEVSSSKNEEQEQYEELELDKSASVEGNPVTEKQKNDQEETKEEERVTNEKSCQLKSKESEDVGSALASEMEKSDSQNSETNAHILIQRSWAPRVYYKLDKEIHYFMGHKITIQESIDSYGGVIWPAAVALCKFLETPVGREHINLFDKETLELGAGTGLLSVVATLLGAKVTATDLPELLGNLKCNLNRNTRGHWRYEPQVAVLSWGHELEQTFPHSEHHYDYVLAADVVYHHDFLDQLLDTMYYLCQPGTNLIWANKVRYKSDLIFTENFKKAFHTTLITELDEVRIYLATHREPGLEEREKRNVQINEKEDLKNQDYKEGSESQRIQRDGQSPSEDTQHEKVYSSSIKEDKELDTKEKQSEEAGLQKERDEEHKAQKKEDKENTEGMDYEESIKDCSGSESISSAQTVEQSNFLETSAQLASLKAWKPNMYYIPNREIHYYLGHKITIEESIDSYGAMIWPAAVALCKFLETPEGQQQINLLDKSVLEIGAGTGLLSIVATLLGAKLTATDLPEILSNLTCNLNRNTRQVHRHEPQVMALSWGHELEETFPHSTYHYDYVLAADVVYHHGFLTELLVTMRHFSQPGTTLIWANKIRYPSDLIFAENFEKAFHATLIAELDEVRIYKATYKSPGESKAVNRTIKEKGVEDKGKEDEEEDEKNKACENCKNDMMMEKKKEEHNHREHQGDSEHQTLAGEPERYKTDREDRECGTPMVHWLRKELHYFIGYEITIEESPGSHGSLRRPAALALCRFLDTASGRQKVKLLDKSVLELGAGSGLVSIVATLLGDYARGHYAENHCTIRSDPQRNHQKAATIQVVNHSQCCSEIEVIHTCFVGVLTIEEHGEMGIRSVTATEVPEVLVNLRCNLNQNTTGHRRHEPQVAALSWGHELEQTFPRSEYHYDYVLAADVVYNHDFLDELLVTMHHFCQSGTTLIWANEIHYPSDLGFTENFKKNFHTSLLANVDDVHIYSATAKQFGKQVFVSTEDSKFSKTLFKDYDDQIHKVKKHIDGRITADKEITPKSVQRNEDPNKHHQCALKFEELTQDTEKKNDKDDIGRKDGHYMETHKSIKNHERVHAEFKEETTDEDEGYEEETTDQLNTSWLQSRTKVKDVIGNPRRTQSINMDRKLCEEKHCFLGHEIRIIDSLEPYGPTVRPAALALCKFLESSPPQISLKSKAVLELGAGTGLVSTVASLLGAWVTATDKAAVLDILSTNISRNTRGLSKHKPQVEALSWSENLSQTFPRSTYHYDVVLAADVVYQHNLLDELLSTMRHFCQPGTILIWANKVRTQTEINFRERFKRTFSTTLLTEMEEVEIYRAKTYRQRWSY